MSTDAGYARPGLAFGCGTAPPVARSDGLLDVEHAMTHRHLLNARLAQTKRRAWLEVCDNPFSACASFAVSGETTDIVLSSSFF